MIKYLCRTLEILKQDSGLLPKPTQEWKVIPPTKGDIAFVSEEQVLYGFDGTNWIKNNLDFSYDDEEIYFDGNKWKKNKYVLPKIIRI